MAFQCCLWCTPRRCSAIAWRTSSFPSTVTVETCSPEEPGLDLLKNLPLQEHCHHPVSGPWKSPIHKVLPLLDVTQCSPAGKARSSGCLSKMISCNWLLLQLSNPPCKLGKQESNGFLKSEVWGDPELCTHRCAFPGKTWEGPTLSLWRTLRPSTTRGWRQTHQVPECWQLPQRAHRLTHKSLEDLMVSGRLNGIRRLNGIKKIFVGSLTYH